MRKKKRRISTLYQRMALLFTLLFMAMFIGFFMGAEWYVGKIVKRFCDADALETERRKSIHEIQRVVSLLAAEPDDLGLLFLPQGDRYLLIAQWDSLHSADLMGRYFDLASSELTLLGQRISTLSSEQSYIFNAPVSSMVEGMLAQGPFLNTVKRSHALDRVILSGVSIASLQKNIPGEHTDLVPMITHRLLYVTILLFFLLGIAYGLIRRQTLCLTGGFHLLTRKLGGLISDASMDAVPKIDGDLPMEDTGKTMGEKKRADHPMGMAMDVLSHDHSQKKYNWRADRFSEDLLAFDEFFQFNQMIDAAMVERREAIRQSGDLITGMQQRLQIIHCLYKASELFNQTETASEVLYTALMQLIKEAVGNYSATTVVRLDINGKHYSTDQWDNTRELISSNIVLDGTLCGTIAVLCPVIDFHELISVQKEEHFFLSSLAELIAVNLKRNMAEQQLKESEAHHRTIFKNSPMGMLLFDDNGVIRDCNDMLVHLVGVPRERVIGFNMVAEDQNTGIVEALQRALAGGQGEYEGTYRAVNGGSHRYLRVIFKATAPTPPTSVIATVEDIMDRHHAEKAIKQQVKELANARLALLNTLEDLEQAKEKAEEATRAKSNFLANMSHEIRTPMNAIMGMTYLVQQTEMTPTQQEYLRKIDVSAQALLHIINDVLDLSKIEAGKIEIETIEFKLSEVLDRVNTMTVLKAEEKGLRLSFKLSPDLPTTFIGDPVRLGQVLLNLIANAVKFTDVGGVEVGIRPQTMLLPDLQGGEPEGEKGNIKEGSNAMILFSVKDSGIGLTPDQKKRLFTAFTQADSSTTRKYGGTGLGLAICKKLTELMGGEIHVESVFGQGSIFTFTVPLGMKEDRPAHGASQGLDAGGSKKMITMERVERGPRAIPSEASEMEEQGENDVLLPFNPIRSVDSLNPVNGLRDSGSEMGMDHTLKTYGEGNKKYEGEGEALAALLDRLRPSLIARKPKPCRQIMVEVMDNEWSPPLYSKLDEMNLLISRYKFKEALALFDSLLEAVDT